MRGATSTVTPPRVASKHPKAADVVRLAATGMRNAETAAALGMTVGAAAGLRNRLGLGSTSRAHAAPKPAALGCIPSGVTAVPLAHDLLAAFVRPPATQGVPFARLDRGACKWPFGEGEAMLFCGAPAVRTPKGTAGPYCPCHAARAFAGRSAAAECAA